MADTPLNAAQLAKLQAVFAKYALRFQQQLSQLDASKSSFSLSGSSEVDAARAVAGQEFSALTTALNTGAIGGVRLSDASFSAQVSRTASALKSYGTALDSWNAQSPSAVLGNLSKGALGLATEMLNAVTAPARFAKNVLIWGTVGIAAIFLLPPLLRTVLAFRKGGTNAALEEGTRALESGRGAVTSAAKKAAALTARAGAAYASGGASERVLAAKNAVSGLRRRSRRRSR